MYRILTLVFSFVLTIKINAQVPSPFTTNPAVITIPSPPTNHTSPTYTVAGTKILLTPGFKYGAFSNATQLLNLSISTYNYGGPNGGTLKNNYTDPNSQPFTGFDRSGPYGITEGGYAVSPNGELIYNIPVICSPGTRGVQPKLSISYNSSGYNGLLGIGWGLTGLSMVERGQKTVFDNATNASIKLTNDDNFLLDGKILIPIAGNNGVASTQYSFEEHNFSRIRSLSTAGNGPGSFEVVSKEGVITEYGNSANSKLFGVGDNTAFSWYINKVTDELGNYMVYNYTSQNGEILLQSISYTGNGSLQPYNTIEFEYMDRADASTLFFGGKAFNNTKILKSIKCRDINYTIIKTYVFIYQYNLQTFLSKIVEIDKNGKQLNPTVINWGTQNKDPFPVRICQLWSQGSANYNNMKHLKAADLNGDGFSDLVYFSKEIIPANGTHPLQSLGKMVPEINFWADDYASITQFNNTDFNFTSSSPATYTVPSAGTDDLCLGMFTYDKNDDNKDEVGIFTSCDNNPGIHFVGHCTTQPCFATAVGCNFNYKVSEMDLNGLSTVFNGSQALPVDYYQFNFDSYRNPNSIPSPFFYDVNDYTGDGIKDKLISDEEKLILITGGSGAQTITRNYVPASREITYVRPGDFNGDGKLEIFEVRKAGQHSGNYEISVLSFNVSTSQFDVLDSKTLFLWNLTTTNGTAWMGNAPSPVVDPSTGVVQKTPNFINLISFGDINADGKTDLVYIKHGNVGGETMIHLSNGSLFEPAIQRTLQSPTIFNKDLVLSLRDVNFDNADDLVLTYFWDINTGNHLFDQPVTPTYSVYLSTGSNFTFPAITITGSSPLNKQEFGDFNGDGDIDFFYKPQNGGTLNPPMADLNFFGQARKRFATKIQNAKETLETEFSYVRSRIDYKSRHRIYEKDITHGNDDYKPDMFVVNFIKNKNIQYRYSYGNGVFDSKRGFLGFTFKKSVNYNDLNGSINILWYDPNYRIIEGSYVTSGRMQHVSGTNSSTIFEYALDASNISSSYTVANTYNSVSAISNPKIVYSDGNLIFSRDYLSSIFYDEVNTYDEAKAGNLIQNQRTYPQGGQNKKISISNLTYVSTTNANGHTVFRLSQKNDGVSTVVNGATSYGTQTNFGYDSQGRLTSTILYNNNSNIDPLTTTYTNFNQFGDPTKVTTSAPDLAFSPFHEVFYDNTGRFITKKTNALGNFEEFIHEPSFGHLTQSKNISGLVTNYSYDGMGRVTMIKPPDNTTNTRTYEWDQNITPFDGSYSITVADEGSPTTVSLYNGLDNVISTRAQGFSGISIVSNNTYDMNNRLATSEEPHFTNQVSYKKIQYQYESYFVRKLKDFLYTITNGNMYSDGTVDYSYNALSTDAIYNKGFVMSKFSSGNRIKKENDITGKVDKILNYTNTMYNNSLPPHVSEYTVHANGQYTAIKNTFPDGSTAYTSMDYDPRGYQKLLVDQTGGTSQHFYNSIGQLTTEITPSGQFDYEYDILGRLKKKTGATSGVTTYQYFTTAVGKELIDKITGPNSVTEFKYDNLNRNTELKETIGTKVLQTNYAYDKYGNQTDYTFPNGFALQKEYDAIGNLLRIKNGNTIIWECNAFNTVGQIGQYTYGNGITTDVNLDDHQNLKEIVHGNIHKQEYDINALTGNVSMRRFSAYYNSVYQEERFAYDEDQRLADIKDAQIGGSNLVQKEIVNYFDNGNIKDRTSGNFANYATYTYGNAPAKPYNLTGITNAPSNISLYTLNPIYTDFKKIKQLTESTSNKQMDFIYGNDEHRIKADYSIGGVNQYTRFYGENYDLEETGAGSKQWCYIYAPTGLAAVYYNNNGTAQILYALSDMLGSPVLLTDQGQTVAEAYSFDAWGRRRNPNDWSYATGYNNLATPTYMIRGYTMHEHIDEFGLINMNGRIYDPGMARFIQPDNFVQAPDNLQNFNRYAYVLNNPLKYKDPSGQFWNVVIGALVGGAINVYAHWDKIYVNGGINWRNAGVAFGLGAVGGAITAATFGAATQGGLALMSGLAVFNMGGVTATMGAMVTNAGNTAYFGDPPMTSRDLLNTYLFGGALAYWAKAVSDYTGPKKLYNDPPSGKSGVGPAESNEGTSAKSPVATAEEAPATATTPKAAAEPPAPVQDAPENLSLKKSVDLDGKISYSAEKEITFTKTAGEHLNEYVKSGQHSGELSRPYMNSRLTLREIMASQPGTPDASYPGGMNYRVPGQYRGHEGFWEVGINPQTNVIYHFNFR